MLFMGIDVGSSSCKISVVGERGELVCSASRDYEFVAQNGLSELNPDTVAEKVQEAIAEISLRNDLSELATLSVTSFGEMFVLMDKDRRVLCNSLSYADPRGQEEAAFLADALGDEIYSVTGATPNAMYSLPKLMWIKKHWPEVYERADMLCLFADFILVKLGAEPHIDYSLAARTLMFDVKSRDWSSKIIKTADIRPELLARPVPAGSPVGCINPVIAEKLRLPKNLMLLAGAHDQTAAALGAGIIRTGMALDGMGSNECIVPAFNRLLVNEEMKRSNLCCIPYLLPGLYVTYAFNRTAGTTLRWYRQLFGGLSYEEIYREVNGEPTGILFLPHFAGAATPYMDDNALGAVVGLSQATTRAELTRSLAEGLSFEALVNTECLRCAGFEIKELFASGGMSKHDEMLQLKADIMGLPVNRLKNPETGTNAMAILGGAAMGVFSSVEEAVGSLVGVEKTFEPNPERHLRYAEIFEKYKRMYSAVKSIQGGMQ